MASVADPMVNGPEELTDGVLMVPGFSHTFALRHGDGLALFDTGAELFAESMHRSVRAWSDGPVTDAVFSHGHIDHIFGLARFDAEADAAGRARPQVVAHENVLRRFARYQHTLGYNAVINRRQFGLDDLSWPTDYRKPDLTFTDTHRLEAGGLVLELTHHRGETDDHAVGFEPARRILFPGDLFLGVAPNCGNPQKVQRYPVEWAAALRWMAGLGAELMLGSHGLPVAGEDRIRTTLENTARYLETLVEQTLDNLNVGATLVDTLHAVRVPDELAELPYLQPLYDEPEFVVRNVWRQFGGWYDGNPARLKPARDSAIALEIAALVGGADVLAARAKELTATGDLRLAAHLAQLAGDAAPADVAVHAVRAEVFGTLVESERSTMSKGIYGWAARESRRVVG